MFELVQLLIQRHVMNTGKTEDCVVAELTRTCCRDRIVHATKQHQIEDGEVHARRQTID